MNLEELIIKLANYLDFDIDEEILKSLKKEYSKANKLKDLPSNIQLLRKYHEMVDIGTIKANPFWEIILTKRKIRSLSGIVPVQVLTKPYSCPGKCIFCPNDKSMPKSYINSEPGAMRALLNEFDPIKQVYNRLLSLSITGHNIEKIELIVLGGCFDTYPKDYKQWFIKSCYDACNTFAEFKKMVTIDGTSPKSAKFTIDDNLNIKYQETLSKTLEQNESAEYRIIGLTIETRSDYVNDKNCGFWRDLGVTRVEMGIQSLYDSVLKSNLRGNTVQDVRIAMHKLRQWGFKVSAHFMPGLYKSSVNKDIATFKKAFDDIYIRPDEIKLYPTSVIVNTELFNLYKQGKYQALSIDEIKKIVKDIKLNYIPPYTRIKRIIRDIPEQEIIAGSNITNLRQLVHNEIITEFDNNEIKKIQFDRLYMNLKQFKTLENLIQNIKLQKLTKQGFVTYTLNMKYKIENMQRFMCLCTRCREVKNKTNSSVCSLIVRSYLSSVGEEYFLSLEDENGILFGFLRLLLPLAKHSLSVSGLGKKTSIVRELHVYGQAAKIHEIDKLKAQHKGYGSYLLNIAEQISKIKKYLKISVISGIGVRNYYKKLGYELEGTYMVKAIVN